MRFFLFFMAALFTSFSSLAAQKYDFKKYWAHETLTNRKIVMQVYTKNSPVKNLTGIATLTVSEKNSDSVDSVLKLLKKSLGADKWTQDKIEGIDIYEKFDLNSMTLFRLAYNSKTKQFSIGSVKTRYVVPSYVEMHLLQVELLTQKKSKTTASFLYDLIFKKAVADDASDL